MALSGNKGAETTGKRLVVIGGTAAGLSAASKARRNDPALSIKVFEKTGFVSYGSCGLPYYVGGIIPDVNELVSLTSAELTHKRGIETLVHHEVTAIDRTAKTVSVLNLDTGNEFTENYDYLVIATGAKPFIPPIKGLEGNGVYTLRSVEDGLKLRQAIADGARRAVVIGGGLIGLEIAEQLGMNRIAVEVVEAAPKLLGFLRDQYAAMVQKVLSDNGIHVTPDTTVEEILRENGNVTGVKTSKGSIIGADMVLVCAGAVPNSGLARDCGLTLGLKGGIVVDDYMQTSDPSIWACGDCVQMKHVLTGQPCYVPLGTTANKQGKTAGGNIGSAAPTPFAGVLGSQVTKIFNLYIASTGLDEEQAGRIGYNAISASITKSDRASYYPGGTDNHLTLTFDRDSGKLLGAQGVGSESIAGRMNVLVAAISAGMTVNELNQLDLVYSPSVAPVYDPLLIAAAQAIKIKEKKVVT